MFNYPFPHRLRDKQHHQSLNGFWQYKILDGNDISSNRFYEFKQHIKLMDGLLEVPYSIEAPKTGINHTLLPEETLLMYLTFDLDLTILDRVFLYFGAVDQRCRIWLNEVEIGFHEDGYLPFEFEITKELKTKDNQLLMAIVDASDEGDLPWGKQRLKHGQIWYTPQSGIWQPCGLISYPSEYIEDFYYTYNPQDNTVSFHTKVNEPEAVEYLLYQPTLLGQQSPEFLSYDYDLLLRSSQQQIRLDPVHLWSPSSPWLYPLDIKYKQDTIRTYLGLRSLGQIKEKKVLKTSLNDEVIFQSGVLDQGYWQDGLYTATDAEFIADLEMVKSMGFNMVRKHIKIEPYRYYFHCDRLGMMVWQDLVNGGNNYSPLVIQAAGFVNWNINDSKYHLFGRSNINSRRLAMIHQRRVIESLWFFPSIVMWCIFNEGWGQFNSLWMAKKARQQDPTRWIDHASGWFDQKGFDFKSVHIYFKKIKLKSDQRMLILSEFGGYSFPVENHSPSKRFGYKMYQDLALYQKAVLDLYLEEIEPYLPILSGICYTQLSDVQEEVNGLVSYDRKVVKWDVKVLEALNHKLIK